VVPATAFLLIGGGALFLVASWLNVKHLPDFLSPSSLLANAILLLSAAVAGLLVVYGLKRGGVRLCRPLPWIAIFVLLALSLVPVAFFARSGPGTAGVSGETGKRYTENRSLGKAPVNVLLITVDTLRADHMHCYGYSRKTSPAMDRLGRDGALFLQCLAPAPNTHPSVASILTSLPVSSFDNYVLEGFVPGTVETMASILKEEGYTTGAVVYNPWLSRAMGFSRGFDTYEEVSAKGGGAAAVTALGLEWIEEKAGEPFFLWIHYLDPHHPYDPPPPFHEAFLPEQPAAPPGGRPKTNTRYLKGLASSGPDAAKIEMERILALYDGEILYTDTEIDRLLAGLERRAFLDRTLTVLTADHGEEFLEHGGMLHGHSLFGELLHVPLLFRLPGRIQPGLRLDARVRALDILPTVLDFCGLPGRDACRGASLYPLLAGGSQALAGPGLVAEKLHRDKMATGPLLSLEEGKYKLVAPYFRPYCFGYSPGKILQSFREFGVFLFGPDEILLFDRALDPGEKHNRASEQKGLARELRRKLKVEARSSPRLGAGEKKKFDSETLERIRSLGYME
jgi:arylsulfatase A-like enzyme